MSDTPVEEGPSVSRVSANETSSVPSATLAASGAVDEGSEDEAAVTTTLTLNSAASPLEPSISGPVDETADTTTLTMDSAVSPAVDEGSVDEAAVTTTLTMDSAALPLER